MLESHFEAGNLQEQSSLHLTCNTAMFFRSQTAGHRVLVQALLAALCLAITLQGGHVCRPTLPAAPGLQADAGAAVPFCTVCAMSGSLIVAIALLLFLFLPSSYRTDFVTVQARSYWQGLRLYVRPPPVLL